MTGDPARAEAVADAAVAAVPASAPVRNARAMLLRAFGRIEEAIAELDHAITLDPKYAEAHTNLRRLVAERDRAPSA
jgi:predicted Zn-dependent protease